MDLPAVFRRAPQLCLIDELAHTNAPGLEHAKRHQDIEDVLDAGIDVFSTVNVQHLESLNDQVAELTGVRVKETFPDQVLSAADEVVLVDLTPEALVQRLREGQVYPPDRVPTALNSFFRVENLSALREVALRQVAEDVEAKRLVTPGEALGTREEALFGDAPQPVAERVLALVRPGDSAQRLVRRAWRSSQRLAADLDLLYVAPPGSPPRGEDREALESLRRLASTLGATLLVEEDDHVAEAAARVAAERGITYVLMGRPRPETRRASRGGVAGRGTSAQASGCGRADRGRPALRGTAATHSRVGHPDLGPDLVHRVHHLERALPAHPRALPLARGHTPGHLGRLVLEALHERVRERPGLTLARDDRERRGAVEAALHLDPALGAGDRRARGGLRPEGGAHHRLGAPAVPEHGADLAVHAGLGRHAGGHDGLGRAQEVVGERHRVHAEVQQRAPRELGGEEAVAGVVVEPLPVVGAERHHLTDPSLAEHAVERVHVGQEARPHRLHGEHPGRARRRPAPRAPRPRCA